MHRIDSSGAVDGLYTAGNPAAGQRATLIDADALNALQEEICNVVEGAGIDLEKGTNDQLEAAIQTKLGNLRGVTSIFATGDITADQMGLLIEVPVSGVTLTLPSAAASIGKVIHIYNTSTGSITIAAGNFNSAYGTATTSIVLPNATSGTFVSDGTSWNAIGGAAAVGSAVKPRTIAGIGQWQAIGITTNLLYVPAGGTWAYWCSNNGNGYCGIAAGTTAIFSGVLNNAFGFCWRIA